MYMSLNNGKKSFCLKMHQKRYASRPLVLAVPHSISDILGNLSSFPAL